MKFNFLNQNTKESNELMKDVAALSNKIKNTYADIGKKFYEENSENPAEGYSEMFDTIKSANEEIKLKQTRLKFLNGIVICTNCEAENPSTVNFCQSCGSRLPHTFVNDSANRCPNCGMEIKPGNAFCGNCGTPAPVAKEPEIAETPSIAEVPELTEAPEIAEVPELTEAPEIAEAPALPLGRKFCPSCGAKVTDPEATFCQECGNKFR